MTATTAHGPGPADTSAFTRHTITAVMAVIAALAFVFSFGNIWALALRLGIPRPIAPLIGPMVDLSVVGLLVALYHLTLKGTDPAHLAPARRLMHLCGALTLALNIAEPIVADHWGRAALDAVAPTLLLGWGAVGPALLSHLHTPPAPAEIGLLSVNTNLMTGITDNPEDTAPDTSAPERTHTPARPATAPTASAQVPAPIPPHDPSSVPVATDPVPPAPVAAPTLAPHLRTSAPTAPPARPATSSAPLTEVPAALLAAARRLADDHQTATGDPITAAQLRARLGVPAHLADAAHAHLAAVPA
ncbi:DUF2637 domain-containing protein [Kitasatospora sp. NPDC093679]|uniref:DUF2637 domain-containing protein n=1 Tax=Kitasatospora sp. NPDC093679 TaxID=3154983 RepID=UPI00343C91E9